MAFDGGAASSGEGVELARGYISLSAKYSPAMAQIAKDFRALENEANAAGVAAGAKLKAGITGGPVPLGTHLRSEFAKAGRSMTSDAEAYGTLIGGMLGRGISAPFRLADRAVGSLAGNIKETVAPMAKMVGGATVLGVAFETMKQGWDLDTKIQDTQVQLQSFGGTAQDVQGFMQSVNDALKGTSNNFADVADAAKGLFFEGARGSGLTEQLKGIANVAAATGASIEQTMNLYEKGVAGGTLSAIVLRGLQQQGPARQAAMRSNNMTPGNEEDEAAFNKQLKGGKIEFEKFWQEFTKESDGAAERMRGTWTGQMNLMKTNLAEVGGDFLKSVFGGGGGKDWAINDQLTKLDGWINANQDKIKTWFHEAATAAHELWDAVSAIVKILKDDFPGGIEGVVIAFGAWKAISAIADMTRDLKTITGIFTKLPGDAAAAGSGAAAGLAPLSAVIAGLTGGLAAVAGFIKLINNFADSHPDNLSQLSNRLGIPQAPTPAGPPVLTPGGVVPPSQSSPAPAAPGDIPGLLLPGLNQHAKGAMIQAPVFPNGIVQWAEPSTGGEAYIPLGLSNRKRSLAIWRETGRRLRAFAGGGFEYPMDPSEVPMGEWAPAGTDPKSAGATTFVPGEEAHLAKRFEQYFGKRMPFGGDFAWQDLFRDAPGNKDARRWNTNIYQRDPGINQWMQPWGGGQGELNLPGGGIGEHRPDWKRTAAQGGIWGGVSSWISHDDGDISAPGDYGASAGSPTMGPPNENEIRSWVAQQFGIPNTTGTGSWENAAHNHDGGWHHRGLGGKDVKSGYAFDFHGTPDQMSALANWVASNYAKDTLELIYSGAGFDHNREIKNGRFGDVYGAGTNSQHQDHVHWAMTKAPGGKDGVVPVDISKVGGSSLGGAKGGGSGGGGDNPLSSLLGIAKTGVTESLLPPGFIDYTKNPWVKSGGALLGMLGSQVGGPGGGMLDMMGSLLGGGGGSGGGLGGGLGDMLMHPLRGVLAQSDPAKAAALGWTQPGEGNSARGHGSISPGQLAFNGGMAAPGHGGITVNGSVIDQGGVDRLNKMQQDEKTKTARAGHSSTVSTQRLGQPGG